MIPPASASVDNRSPKFPQPEAAEEWHVQPVPFARSPALNLGDLEATTVPRIMDLAEVAAECASFSFRLSLSQHEPAGSLTHLIASPILTGAAMERSAYKTLDKGKYCGVVLTEVAAVCKDPAEDRSVLELVVRRRLLLPRCLQGLTTLLRISMLALRARYHNARHGR